MIRLDLVYGSLKTDLSLHLKPNQSYGYPAASR